MLSEAVLYNEMRGFIISVSKYISYLCSKLVGFECHP